MNRLRHPIVLMGALLSCLLIAACVSFMPRSNPDYQAAKPHHRPDGFVNRYAERSEDCARLLRLGRV